MLHSERFVDHAPAEVYATLLDEGLYHCSPRTMYRVLAAAEEVRERRNQLRHPAYQKPELLATGPNQVWSWDITKLLARVYRVRFDDSMYLAKNSEVGGSKLYDLRGAEPVEVQRLGEPLLQGRELAVADDRGCFAPGGAVDERHFLDPAEGLEDFHDA